MISGNVTADREIVIPVEALAADRSVVSIRAIVDTGFNGYLTLPTDVLSALGAFAAGTRRAELGDGNLVELDVYAVRVKWHDVDRDVLALKADTTPLVGMSLLWGSNVVFDARDRGTVTISAVA